jgi:cellobiose phosphorylase
MYGIALQYILGFQQQGEQLVIKPCIPANWKGFTVNYRFRSSTYEITVENPDGIQCGSIELMVDGRAVDGSVDLVDDGRVHRVIASMRPASAPSAPEKQEKARR